MLFVMKRNYGLDLLRLVLMFMVVVLHVLGHGGVLNSAIPLTAQYNVAWLLEALAYCAVNCYALISGYVYIDSKYKFSSLILIWLQVLVYSLGIGLCVWVAKPDTFSLRVLIDFLFPVSKSRYWYFSAYFGLFILIPFLNAAINALPKTQLKSYIFLLFLVFSVLPTFARQDTFSLNSGYSMFWLAYLYIIGACIKKCDWWNTLESRLASTIYLSYILISWGIKISFEGITTCLFGYSKAGYTFISYTSPTMVLAAVALFISFKNATVSPKLTRLISQLSPAAFGVYLIHEHQYIKEHLIVGKFSFLCEYNTPLMVIGVIASALLIFSGCLFIDWVRCKIFKSMHVKEFLEKIESKYIHYNFTV
jgi:surface polysaccharide O-acyltransferase-like enzyme